MRYTLFLCCLLAIAGATPAVFARGPERELRRMVGYTIVASETVESCGKNDQGDDIVTLSNGQVFSVNFLGWVSEGDDVVVFVKAPNKQMREALRGQVPDRVLFSFKLLIDDEMYDADLIR